MASNDYVGQTINGKYSIFRLIGRGGIGAVFFGRHIVSDEPVAVKFIHSQFAENKNLLKQFYREAEIAAQIGHPNICETYDMGVSESGEPFIVMEYLDGESLASFLSRSGPLSLEVTCAVMESVLLALEAAHGKGIVHRYLKPENIFIVNKDNAGPQIKLVDFGVSKFTNPDDVDLTKYGVRLSTPVYYSPEQIVGADIVDRKADLYAIGVLLYKMLTGNVPYQGNHYHEILIALTNHPPLSPFEANPSFPPEAETLIMRCLEKNPHQRPENTGEVLHYLRGFSAFEKRNESLLAAVTNLTMGTMIGKGSTVIGDLSGTVLDAAAVTAAKKKNENANRDFSSKSNSQLARELSSSASNPAVKHAKQKRNSRSSKGPARVPSRSPGRFRFGIWHKYGNLILSSAIAVSFLVTGITAYFVLREKKTDDTSDSVSEETSSTTGTVSKNSETQQMNRNDQSSGNNVQIEVRGLPADAKITYNGIPIPFNPFKVEARESIVPMKVEAPGYQNFVTSVVPSEDQVVVVSMTPLNAVSDVPQEIEQRLYDEVNSEVQPSQIEPEPEPAQGAGVARQKKKFDTGRPLKKRIRKKNQEDGAPDEKEPAAKKKKNLFDMHDIFE